MTVVGIFREVTLILAVRRRQVGKNSYVKRVLPIKSVIVVIVCVADRSNIRLKIVWKTSSGRYEASDRI